MSATIPAGSSIAISMLTSVEHLNSKVVGELLNGSSQGPKSVGTAVAQSQKQNGTQGNPRVLLSEGKPVYG
ncbi:MAG: hypothetical protein ACP5O0_06055 [Acidimicrobiales bacterium]